MKIAVISDTHIPARLQTLPGLVYESCADVDLIIHAGDVEDSSVITDLQRLAPIKVVRGNMDKPDYPQTLSLNLEGFTVCVAHGTGAYYNVRERLQKMFNHINPDIIIHGHTHNYHWEKTSNIWFLCPGAVSNPIGSRSVVILSLEKGKTPDVRKISF